MEKELAFKVNSLKLIVQLRKNFQKKFVEKVHPPLYLRDVIRDEMLQEMDGGLRSFVAVPRRRQHQVCVRNEDLGGQLLYEGWVSQIGFLIPHEDKHQRCQHFLKSRHVVGRIEIAFLLDSLKLVCVSVVYICEILDCGLNPVNVRFVNKEC